MKYLLLALVLTGCAADVGEPDVASDNEELISCVPSPSARTYAKVWQQYIGATSANQCRPEGTGGAFCSVPGTAPYSTGIYLSFKTLTKSEADADVFWASPGLPAYEWLETLYCSCAGCFLNVH
jgi:hypothetical protein